MRQINVTKTYLPELGIYNEYLKRIWNSGWVTNNGPCVQELEMKLKKYLGVKYLYLVSNGTLGLQIAIKALGLKGEVITTPFSYVATSSSLVWEGCKPVFADIKPGTLDIDPAKIEAAITKKTSAILAVHIYGNSCDVARINNISKKYKLKIIYDAAHAFGVKYKDKYIGNYGDISVFSLHATKIFHTGEGGIVATNSSRLAKKLSYLRNFGHKWPEEGFQGVGINAKMSELNAAMGLSVLPKVNFLINKRKKVVQLYDRLISKLPLEKLILKEGLVWNYSYYPVVFETESKLLEVVKHLNKNNIFPRRYFYPALNELSYVECRECPIAENVSKRIICLPLHHDLSEFEVKKIVMLIKEKLK
jgi:dTDP-4-amino-4,6-dideoxygalactose transaminase